MKYQAAVITVSDKGFRGERTDTSGPALCNMLEEAGWEVVFRTIVPDDMQMIKDTLTECADKKGIPLVLTTGGTGFSPRDVTPEATKAVIERETPGLPEAMRAESMKITPHGCLSRSAAGIRGRTLIINLPGSEKAARENLQAVLKPVRHGMDMLYSEGSAGCAGTSAGSGVQSAPSADAWLREAKADESASACGMYLFHNGVVRRTAKAEARMQQEAAPVCGMEFSYDAAKVEAAVENARKLPGIGYVRVWLNEGTLKVGDDIMQVLIGGDIRPNVVNALQTLVGELKENCVTEKELYVTGPEGQTAEKEQ